MHTIHRSATQPERSASSRTITYAVAAGDVAGLRAGLLGMYSTRADALSMALSHHLSDTAGLAEVAHHRNEIRAIEALLNQLGWEHSETLEAITVTGSQAILRDGYHAALLQASDDFSRDLGDLDWPLHVLPRVTTALGQAQRLVDRVVELSVTEPEDPSVTPVSGVHGGRHADRS